MRPSHPCSASFAQSSGRMPSGVSMSRRTVSEGNSFSKNFRAVLRRSSCSSLKPKFMGLAFRESEHALADDVLLDLGGAALDGVGARAEEAVLPEPVLDGPPAALGELGVGALELHGHLLETLMALHPHHLAGGGLGPGQLALEELGDGARAGVLEHLGIDPELRELLAGHGILRRRRAVLGRPPRELDEAIEGDAEPHLEAE